MSKIKKMKSHFKLFFCLISIFGLICSNSVQAAETNSPIQGGAEPILVADVNIYQSKIIKQDGNNFELEFELFNNDNKAQGGIKYFVELVEEKEESINGEEFTNQYVKDFKVYDEVVNLTEKQSITKKILYSAPDYLSGKYQIWIKAQGSSGLLFGLNNAGEVTLSGNKKGIIIDPASCYLSVKNEEDVHYAPRQGIAVKSEEILVAYCEAKNETGADQIILPSFETKKRNFAGESVSETESIKQEKVTLKKDENKQIYFTLPKAKSPQAYDAIFTLKNEKKEAISNSVIFHYVLAGKSASIQNLRLDKDYYRKNETAKVSFFWSGSADSFPDSRLGEGTKLEDNIISIKVIDKNNQLCGEKTEKAKEAIMNIKISIKRDCENPNIEAQIKDKGGDILAKENYQITSGNKSQAEAASKNNLIKTIFLILSLILIALVITVFALKKKKISSRLNSFLILFFLVFISLLTLLPKEKVEAATFVIYTNNYTVQLDKREYAPGAEAIISASAQETTCANLGYRTVRVSGTINGATKNIINDTHRMLSQLPPDCRYTSGSNFTCSQHDWKIENISNNDEWGSSSTVFAYHENCEIKYVCVQGEWGSQSCINQRVCASNGTFPYGNTGWVNLSGSDKFNVQTEPGNYNANYTGELIGGATAYFSGYGAVSGVIPYTVIGCSGVIPANATLCSSDNQGVSGIVSRIVTNACGAPKCEYICNSGFQNVNGACVAIAYSCTGGNPPQGASWCTGDDTGLTASLPWSNVGLTSANCTANRKCEYYVPIVQFTCTGGNPPQGASWCTGDDTGLTSNLSWQQVATCTNARKCEYTFATLQAPTCQVNFSPSNISVGEETTATWSSTNATNISFVCTGPVAGNGSSPQIALSGTETHRPTINGTELCNITVTGAGGSSSCSGGYTVGGGSSEQLCGNALNDWFCTAPTENLCKNGANLFGEVVKENTINWKWECRKGVDRNICQAFVQTVGCGGGPTSCSGTIEFGGTVCSGDGDGNIQWHKAGTSNSSCTAATKCEYYVSDNWGCDCSQANCDGQCGLIDVAGRVTKNGEYTGGSCSCPSTNCGACDPNWQEVLPD